MIELKDLLDIVRTYAEKYGWCGEVEKMIRKYAPGIVFVWECRGCGCWDCARPPMMELSPRFTLADGSITQIHEWSLASILRCYEFRFYFPQEREIREQFVTDLLSVPQAPRV